MTEQFGYTQRPHLPPDRVSSLLFRRFAFTALPLCFLGVVVVMAIFGDHGLVRRHDLRQERVEIERRVKELKRRNTELRRDLRLLETEPLGLRRVAAKELLMAPADSTIYRFESAIR